MDPTASADATAKADVASRIQSAARARHRYRSLVIARAKTAVNPTITSHRLGLTNGGTPTAPQFPDTGDNSSPPTMKYAGSVRTATNTVPQPMIANASAGKSSAARFGAHVRDHHAPAKTATTAI